MRHNAIRYTAAFILREARCKDVRIEPALLTVQQSSFSRKTNPQDEGRLNVSVLLDCMHPLKEHSMTSGSHILTVTQIHLSH